MERLREGDVLKIIQNALNIKEECVTVDSTMDDLEEWDSLGHLSILVTLDKRLNGRVAAIKDIATAASVREILQILKDNSLCE